MSHPIDLNKTTFTQLKTIKGLGETKARAIIEKREEVGELTIDDLQAIPGISAPFINSLFSENIVILGSKGASGEKDTVPKLQNLVQDLRRKIDEMNRERSEYADSFELRVQQLKDEHVKNAETLRLQNKTQMQEQQEKFEEEFNKFKKLKDGEFCQLKETLEQKDKEIQESQAYAHELNQQIIQSRLESVIKDREAKQAVLSDRDDKQKEAKSSITTKMSTYDGKMDWRPYHLQFTIIADHLKWSTEQRLFKLIECLRDKALVFYSDCPKSVQTDYELLCKKFSDRFCKNESAHILRRLLQDTKQEVDESVVEFAERVRSMAEDGYPETPIRVVETLAMDSFLRGCLDKKSALVALDKNPSSLNDAVEYVKTAASNHRVIMGKGCFEVRPITSDDSNARVSEFLVRKLEKEKEMNWVNNFEKRQISETDISKTKIGEINLYENKGAGATFCVRLSIGGIPVLAVVDCAAQASILNYDIFMKLGSQVKLSERVVIRGIDKNSKVLAHCTNHVNLQLGKHKFHWNFVVADVKDKVILGLDFLEFSRTKADFGNYRLEVKNEVLQGERIISKVEEFSIINRNSLDRQIEVPQDNMEMVVIDTDRLSKSDILIQPKNNLKGLIAQNVFINKVDVFQTKHIKHTVCKPCCISRTDRVPDSTCSNDEENHCVTARLPDSFISTSPTIMLNLENSHCTTVRVPDSLMYGDEALELHPQNSDWTAYPVLVRKGDGSLSYGPQNHRSSNVASVRELVELLVFQKWRFQ